MGFRVAAAAAGRIIRARAVRPALVLALGFVLVVGGLVAGCGSGTTARSTTGRSTTARSTTARTTTSAIFGAPSGPEVFASACQVCHSLGAHNRPSQQGGDLRTFHGSLVELRQLTAEMPVVHHRLSPAELAAVVNYVAAVAHVRH